MNFKTERIKDFYLLATEVENIFINEYLPQAPGDYVKVYLYALLYAKQQTEITHRGLAAQLGLKDSDVDLAWQYWERMGVVKREMRSDTELDYGITFVNLRELMYAGSLETPQKSSKSSETLCENELKEIFDFVENLKGQPVSPKEMQEIASWHSEMSAEPALIQKAFEYCYEKGKTQLKYIGAVIREWAKKGITTVEKADEYIEETSRRYGDYKRILNSLGVVGRMATDGERKIIDKWFDEMGFSLERILDACQKTVGIQNPNVNYVNKILENWQKEAASFGRDVNRKTTVSQTDLNSYYDFLRHDAERKAQEAKREVYEKLPRIEEIDESLKDLGSRLSRAVLSGSEDLEEIKKLTTLLEQERAVLLTENNFPLDFTDVKYLCSECHDTGVNDAGRRCVCVRDRIGDAELWLNARAKKSKK